MRALLLLLFMLFHGMLFGAPAATRTCRVLFLEAPADAPDKLWLFDGTQSRQVELPRMNLSQVYELPAGALTLHLLPQSLADPAAVPAGSPAVQLAEDITDFYLLVRSDPANTVAPVKMEIIDAGGHHLKAGQSLWINMTPHAVGGVLGSQNIEVEANKRVVIDAPAARNEEYSVALHFRVKDKDTLYPLCETKWRHDPRSRSLVFVIMQNGVRTPRIMGFSDFREKAQNANH